MTRFIWIDDKKDKVETYRAAIERGAPRGVAAAKLELLHVQAAFLDELKKWVHRNRGDRPALIIIDHVFVPLPFGIKGSTVAHLLRQRWPLVPMVCVTAKLDVRHAFDQEDLSEYTAVFSYMKLDDCVEDLYVIARDFPKLAAPATRIQARIITCLQVPEADSGDVVRALPEEFQSPRRKTTEHRVASWIYKRFLRHPGFLYDSLHAATLLGLSEEAFLRIEEQFEDARYRGVFATSSSPRWWAAELVRILFKKAGKGAPDLPQLAGRTLRGVSQRDFSKCYVSKSSDPPPDAVVYMDASVNAKRCVVQRRFSKQHPHDPGTAAGFESYLVLQRSRH